MENNLLKILQNANTKENKDDEKIQQFIDQRIITYNKISAQFKELLYIYSIQIVPLKCVDTNTEIGFIYIYNNMIGNFYYMTMHTPDTVIMGEHTSIIDSLVYSPETIKVYGGAKNNAIGKILNLTILNPFIESNHEPKICKTQEDIMNYLKERNSDIGFEKLRPLLKLETKYLFGDKYNKLKELLNR